MKRKKIKYVQGFKTLNGVKMMSFTPMSKIQQELKEEHKQLTIVEILLAVFLIFFVMAMLIVPSFVAGWILRGMML